MPDTGIYDRTAFLALLDGGGQVFNVKNKLYGASGNGSTVDTTALQNCAADAMSAKGTMLIPDGTFICDGTIIEVTDTLVVMAHSWGGEIKLKNGTTAINQLFNVTAGGKLVLIGLRLNGNKANQSSTNIRAVMGNHTSGDIEVTARGCWIHDFEGPGIRCGGADTAYNIRADICDNLVESTDDHAIYLNHDCIGGLVAYNRIYGTGTGANGIWCGEQSHGLRIIGNYLESVGDIGIEVFATNPDTNEGVVVSGNTVRSATNQGISVDSCPHADVSSNTVYDSGGAGIEVVDSPGASVHQNAVSGAALQGIVIDRDSPRSAVTGNTISDCGTATPDAGIRVITASTQDGSDCAIVGNTVYIKTSVACRGIDLFCNAAGASINRAVIVGNTIVGDGTSLQRGIGVSNPGSGTMNDNKIANNTVYNVDVPYNDDGTRTRINGLGSESANAETPTAASWDPGDVVDFTDSGDASGDGMYRLGLDGSTWTQVG